MVKKAQYATVSAAVVAMIAIVLWAVFRPGSVTSPGMAPLTTSEFVSALRSEDVRTARWQGNEIRGELASGSAYRVTVPGESSPGGETIMRALQASRANWQLDAPTPTQSLAQMGTVLALPILLSFLAWLLFLGSTALTVVWVVRRLRTH
jgi:ATP-dependent Zn protease